MVKKARYILAKPDSGNVQFQRTIPPIIVNGMVNIAVCFSDVCVLRECFYYAYLEFDTVFLN